MDTFCMNGPTQKLNVWYKSSPENNAVRNEIIMTPAQPRLHQHSHSTFVICRMPAAKPLVAFCSFDPSLTLVLTSAIYALFQRVSKCILRLLAKIPRLCQKRPHDSGSPYTLGGPPLKRSGGFLIIRWYWLPCF